VDNLKLRAMEEKPDGSMSGFDLIRICDQVPEAGNLIFERLSIMDLFNLSLTNKQLQGLICNYGKLKKDLSAVLVSSQPLISKKICNKKTPLPFTSMSDGNIAHWTQPRKTYGAFEPYLYCAVFYDLNDKNIPEYELNIRKEHFPDLNCEPKHHWYDFSYHNYCISQDGKIMIHVTYEPSFTTSYHHVVLLYDLKKDILLNKIELGVEGFAFTMHPKAGGLFVVKKLHTENTTSTKTMEVEVNVNFSKDNFSQKKKVCQIRCPKGRIDGCVAQNEMIAFQVNYLESNGVRNDVWYRLKLCKDLTSVIHQDTLTFDFKGSVGFLKNGSAHKKTHEGFMLCFFCNGQRKDVSLDGAYPFRASNTNSKGSIAVTYCGKGNEKIIALFDNMGNLKWKKSFESMTFVASSIA